MKIVVALGGNALVRPGKDGGYDELVRNVKEVSKELVRIIETGHQLVITHGNGPQVGSLAIQQSSTEAVPELPLHVLDAMTQGEIGYLIQRELGNALAGLGSKRTVVSLVTQVLVDPADPAFGEPTKPIGPFYGPAEARRVAKEKGFTVKKVGQGARPFRRVVPSPEPMAVLEAEAVSRMLAAGSIVIAGGGGGIPVARTASGVNIGVDAVVDKDLSAEKLAEGVRADVLLILTSVSKVKSGFGTSRERDIDEMSVAEAKLMLEKGEFPPGSMGPKMMACIRFVEWGGKPAMIASLSQGLEALGGSAGTRIVPG